MNWRESPVRADGFFASPEWGTLCLEHQASLSNLTESLARFGENSLQNFRFSLVTLLLSSSSVEVIINTYNIYMGAPLRRLLRVIRAHALNGFSSVPGSLE
jgi:hypothetical protein